MDDQQIKQRRLTLNEEIERRQAAQVLQPPPPEPRVIGDGQGNPNSAKTLEKLRGLTRMLSGQLTEVRNAHVIKITTLATELVDLQNETIVALEARIVELESQVQELEAELHSPAP